MTASIMAALVAAQGDLTNPPKDKTANTGTFKYAYADLAGILDHVRPILARHGLAVTQDVRMEDGRLLIHTRLLHKSGESLDYGPLAGTVGSKWQDVGSGITYARRYALQAVLGIAADEDDVQSDKDDDAASATPPATARSKPTSKPKAVANDEQVLAWVSRIDEAGDFIALKKIGHEISEHDLDSDVRAELLRQWKQRKAVLDAS